MGMAASQARLLSITARMSNLEFEGQQINQSRTDLAQRTAEAAKNYQQALTNRRILFDPLRQVYNDDNNYEIFTYNNIVNSVLDGGLGMRLVDANGRVIVPNLPDGVSANSVEALNYLVDDKVLDAQYLEEGLREKGWQLQQPASYSTVTEKGWTESELVAKISAAQDGEVDEQSLIDVVTEFLKQIFSSNTNEQSESTRLVDSNGKILVTQLPDGVAGTPEAANYKIIDSSLIDTSSMDKSKSDIIAEKIKSGEWIIQEETDVKKKVATSWSTTSWSSTTGVFDVLDTTDDGEAEATYTALNTLYQSQDKQLEMRQKQVESEHSALQTEYDAVKKVIDKNVETTFKTFG